MGVDLAKLRRDIDYANSLYLPASAREVIGAAAQLAEEVERLNRLEAEAWGIRFCCNERDCGCHGEPIDPPAWWTPDIRALQDDLTTLRAENAQLGETLKDLVEYVMGWLSYMTSDKHPLDKAQAALPQPNPTETATEGGDEGE